MERSTYVQIDLQSLMADNNPRLDFVKLWDHFNSRDGEFFTGATIYIIRSRDAQPIRFDTKLKSLGYEIKTKTLPRKISHGTGLYSLSLQITIDCMDRLQRFDKWIFISASSTMVELMEYLKNKGKYIELWTFRSRIDSNSQVYADITNYLEDGFCLKKSSISVFGFNWDVARSI